MTTSRDLKKTIEEHIHSFSFEDQKPVNLYKPIAYILSLKGKRIRPILTLLAYRAVSGRAAEGALNLAMAVEFFHNFTLMHDDIMDRAPVRRGKPTVHKVWNEDVAILSGDALFAFSMGLVVKDFPEKATALCLEYARVAMEVCEGQMEDMDFSSETHVTIPDYLEMIRKKTAALLGGCMSLGAIAGGADDKLVAEFRSFGENLGLGFQLQDDLMDAFPPEGFGKQVGGDIIENKKTYLVLKALELAHESQRNELFDLFLNETNVEKKVNRTLEIFNDLDIKQHTQDLIQNYFARAATSSQALSARTDFNDLKEYLQEIFKRKF